MAISAGMTTTRYKIASPVPCSERPPPITASATINRSIADRRVEALVRAASRSDGGRSTAAAVTSRDAPGGFLSRDSGASHIQQRSAVGPHCAPHSAHLWKIRSYETLMPKRLVLARHLRENSPTSRVDLRRGRQIQTPIVARAERPRLTSHRQSKLPPGKSSRCAGAPPCLAWQSGPLKSPGPGNQPG